MIFRLQGYNKTGGEIVKKIPYDFRVDYPDFVKWENQPMPLIQTDPFGSYTGRGENPYEKPVQDADDL